MVEMKRVLTTLVLLSLIAGLAVPVVAQTSGQKTMLENLAGMKEFSTLASAAKAAGLDNVLGGTTAYTLFAPSNAAFDKFPKDAVSALVNDKARLADLLRFHVVPGKVTYSDLAGMSEIKTVDGRTLPIGRQDGAITVGGTKLLNQGIDSKNGVIYTIDNVMTPPGFAMPQAPAAPAMNWGWLPWLIGALALGGLALYLLTRRKKYPEPRAAREPARAKAMEKPGYEEMRARVEETRRPEETMKQVRETVAPFREPQIADIVKNLNLPLTGDAAKGLNMLIDSGAVKDRPDFISLLAKSYLQNDMDSVMSGGREPHETRIMDIIHKTGIARGFFDTDIKKYLVPLFITGFTAIYNYLSKRPAVKAT
jgi:uncharacterized surface protein with fasciclin (FAS1) repeats